MFERWTHRTHRVSHSKDGWALRVYDEAVLGTVAEVVAERALALLGHPCCGRGPLAKLQISFRQLRRFGVPTPGDVEAYGERDENALDYFWYRVLNLPNRFHRSTELLRLPMTEEQARTLAPDFVDFYGPEDDEE
jgi:hypothetical protein